MTEWGVFEYSIEETTPSFILGDPVSKEEKERRKDLLMTLQRDISHGKNQKMVGKKIKVIIDDIEDEHYIARSERDAPEVDGEVIIEPNGNYLQVGNIYEVDIYDCNEYDLFGKVISNGGSK
ncbi:MAG: hypothetical protein U5K00_17085 [Melioribacteraceae bacterium]|nr:hypothetical protein [Melioribacteraceae bacterium]